MVSFLVVKGPINTPLHREAFAAGFACSSNEVNFIFQAQMALLKRMMCVRLCRAEPNKQASLS